MGIPKEDQERIFEAFEQQSGQRTRQFEGTGLGLAITRRLVEMMGGEITVKSEPGKGSLFTVRLKQIEPAAVVEARAEPQSQSEYIVRFEPSKVLIVEDNVMNRSLIYEYLNDSGLEVIEAENGAVALEMTRAHRPHLILLDLNMPIMDGREAAAQIREDPDIADIPIVVLTASAQAGEEELTTKLDLQGFLMKPITKDYLIEHLRQFLPHHISKIKSADMEDSAHTPSLETVDEEVPIMSASERSRLSPLL